MSELGEFLRKLRGKMSLREAAKRSGLSYSYISSLESGKHPRTGEPITPSPDSLKSLSKAYHYDYKELMKMAGHIDLEQHENEFIKDIEIYSPEDMINKYNVKIDGKPMTEDEAKDFLAFLRTKRSL